MPTEENPVKNIEAITNSSINKDISLESLSTTNYTYLGFSYSSSTKTLSAKYQKKIQIKTDTYLNSVSNESDYGKAYNIISSDSPDYYNNPLSVRKYDKESKVLLYALPTKDNCDFVGWKLNGMIVSNENPLEITATSDSTYTAVYEDDYNYLYFENTSNNIGVVSMYIVGFDLDVHHVRDKAQGEDISGYKHPDEEHVYVDDDGHDIYTNDERLEYANGYKHVTLKVPDLFLEYRLDKYVQDDSMTNGNGYYKVGFWKDFNKSGNVTDEDCYEDIDLNPKDKILFRAKKINGKYETRSIADFKDNRLYGLPGETYYILEDGDRSDPSVCLASHQFELIAKEENKNPQFSAGGSITSILDGKGSNKNLDITKINGGEEKEHYFTYAALFARASYLNDISKLTLTSTNTTLGCYYALFQGTGIQYIPRNFLPAVKLASSCYAYMFAYSKLISLKGLNLNSNDDDFILPATDIAGRCYFSMFQDCKQLISVPDNLVSACTALMDYQKYEDELSLLLSDPTDEAKERFNNYAMTQAKCYYSMFRNCINLTNMPKLESLILQPYCYEYMFYNCYSLDCVVDLPAQYLYDYCYSHMFDCEDGHNSKINEIYLGALEWGLMKEREVHEGTQYPYSDFNKSLYSFVSFLGHVDSENNAKAYGVSVDSGCKIHARHNALTKDNSSGIFVGKFKDVWDIDYNHPQHIDPPTLLNDAFEIDEVIDETINNEISDDFTQELPEQLIEDVIENDDDIEDINDVENIVEVVPHKEDEFEEIEQLEHR